MFADNQKISWLQMERQFALAYLGPIVLWLPGIIKGRNGVISTVLGALILCIWIFFLLRQVHVYRFPEKYWGRLMGRVIGFGYEAYLILTGSWLVGKISGLLSEYVIQGVPVWILSGIFVLAALGGSQEIQARGRFAQAVWPLAAGFLGLLLILSAFQGEPELLIQESGRSVWNSGDGMEIIRGTGWYLAAFLGAGLLPFLLVQTESGKNHAGSLFFTVGRMALWTAGILLILQSVFGSRGAEDLPYPIMDLMAGVNLPGGFLRRVDLLFLTVVLFCLLFTLGSIFFYSKYILERVQLPSGRAPAAVLSFLLGNVSFGSWSLAEEYPFLLLWIFLPFFLVLGVCTAFVRRRSHGK